MSDLSSTKYENSNLFIDRLRTIKDGHTQKELAEWLGISITTLNGYFTGNSRPNLDFLVTLAKKGINLNWFITGVGPLFIDYPEYAIYTPEEQVFLHDLETEEGGITNKDEAIKSFRQLKEYQKHTNANKTEYVIGLKILKTTYGKRHQNIKTDTSL
ncbi:MAG: helix-turn-helix transcriptional regulator [Bacteroidetes bacterium]|nr:helix-turn-helix transcriptional regulator [Bacteroidota bacterium]